MVDKIYALVRNSDGFITNVIVWGDPTPPPNPDGDHSYIEDLPESGGFDPDGLASVGGTWDGGEFFPPPDIPPPDPVITLEDRVTSLEADWAEDGAMRLAIEAAIELIPVKATNSPTAVSASSAVGAVETKFALEDHAHAINATQQGAINTLNSAMSVQQSLTGGLNTPAPATATPVALGSAAVGASTKYAREDHVHPLPIMVASAPSRTLNSAGFQPSTTKATQVSYSVRITCTASLAGGQDGKIELMSDSGSTPTAVRATAQNRNSVSLAIALTAVNEQTVCLTYLVPAGHYVRLVSTQTTGTPSFAIISQTEVALG